MKVSRRLALLGNIAMCVAYGLVVIYVILMKIAGEIGRVETWRGGGRIGELPLADGFRLNAGASIRSIAPFPRPAHRTGRADFPHPALGQGFMRSHADSDAEAKAVAPSRAARSGTGMGIVCTRRSTPCGRWHGFMGVWMWCHASGRGSMSWL